MATSTLGNGTLVLAGTTSGTTTVTATAVAGTTTLTLPAATDTLVGKATTDTLTNKTLTGAVMNGTLGATTPSTVAATTLTTSSTVTHNGGTANGVGYLDGSKVLTTGSALVFDGTNLGIGTSSPTSRLHVKGTDVKLTFETNTGASAYIQQLSAAPYNVSFFNQNAGSLIFGTDNAEKARIDSSGNLGIGTTSPSFRLHAVSSAAVVSRIGSSGGSGAFINFIDSGASPSVAPSVGAIGNNLVFMGDGSSSERARITSGGYFKASNTGTYQNATSTYHELRNDANANTVRITNTIASGYTDAIVQVGFTAYAPNTTNSWFLFCDDSTTNRVQLRSNGGIANYSANDVNLSDRREKTNFAPAGSYLDKICAIPVQTFNYIDQNLEEDGGLTLGVVAQDVQAVAPELVMESNWAKNGDEPKMRLSIYQTDLQYALMKCIQEQQALITQLTARITALESA